MGRRRRKTTARKWLGRIAVALMAIPALYLLAALVGSLMPVNRGWIEPARGTTVYLASNGVHADIVMPLDAHGLDWAPLFPIDEFARVEPGTRFIAFGAGEERVYINTPTWWDLTPRTAWAALAGGKRVMHVEYVPAPSAGMRAVTLRPDEYRRLWAAIRSDLGGAPKRIDHPGYGPRDAFYRATGKASALRTCNSWAADKLRLAGVRTSLWPPFVQGLTWRYRLLDQST
jgi:uncharacterized protein (TIGR02117 family)